MMGTREPLKGGDEYDYLTRARRYYNKRAGKFKPIKQGFWRRVRKIYRLAITNEAALIKESWRYEYRR